MTEFLEHVSVLADAYSYHLFVFKKNWHCEYKFKKGIVPNSISGALESKSLNELPLLFLINE